MTQSTLTPTVSPSPYPLPPIVQTGPMYFCPLCGTPANTLVPWPSNPNNPSPLDAWGPHIWYLKRRCQCKDGSRVARIGDCITRLELGTTYEEDAAAISAALTLIAHTVPVANQTADPVARIVFELMAGLVSPAKAIIELKQMTKTTAPLKAR